MEIKDEKVRQMVKMIAEKLLLSLDEHMA